MNMKYRKLALVLIIIFLGFCKQVQAEPEIDTKRTPISWRVIFRSKDPSHWNNYIDNGTNAFSVSLGRNSDPIEYIKIFNTYNRQTVIFETGGCSTQDLAGIIEYNGYAWNGTCKLISRYLSEQDRQCEARMLGIANLTKITKYHRGTHVHQLPSQGRDGYTGWGFGRMALVYSDQIISWDNLDLPIAVLEISIGSGRLSSEENEYVVNGAIDADSSSSSSPASECKVSSGRSIPEKGKGWRSPSTGMEFFWIDALNMWVGKYEVTNGEYRKKEPQHDSKEYKGHSLNQDRQPAVFMNFNNAASYAKWLTKQDFGAAHFQDNIEYRLPTGNEWMVFAQCGDGRKYPWGNCLLSQAYGYVGNYYGQEWQQGDSIPNYNDGFLVSCDVEDSWKNPWGLFGVGGNIKECTTKTPGGEFGGWCDMSWVYREERECSYSDGSPAFRTHGTGFRLVLAPEEQNIKFTGIVQLDWNHLSTYLEEFKPTHIAVFCGGHRKDLSCKNGFHLNTEFKWSDDVLPDTALVWPYRAENPPVWGRKTKIGITCREPGSAEVVQSTVQDMERKEVLPGMRIWTDAKGNVFEGEFVAEIGHEVCLKGRDGNTIKVPFAKLSKQDREYIESNRPLKLSIDVGKVENESSSYRYEYGKQRPGFRVKIVNESISDIPRSLDMHLYIFSENDQLVRHEYAQGIAFTGREKRFEYLSQPVRFYGSSSSYSSSSYTEYGGYLVLVTSEGNKVEAMASSNKKAEDNIAMLIGYATDKINGKSSSMRELQPASPSALKLK